MKTINLKIFGTMFLLSFSFPVESVFAKDIVKPDPFPEMPSYSSMQSSYNTMQIESISPITYDILGNNLVVSFNSPVDISTVTITDQYGNAIYQSAVDTNTESDLFIPIENWETGNYTITVTSESANFVGGFQL